MRVPERLLPLLDQGVITDVIRPLMAGKEAQIYLVEARGELRVAKVYKEAANRSFKHRSVYTEGRRVRNTRQQRAMNKRSKHGRRELEEAWRNAEVDAIYRLRAANVRVPEPYDFIDGVLVMEMVRGPDGEPAPRLADLAFEPQEAEEVFQMLLREVVKMLCAGVVHGDLSDFNVLMGVDGPVIIDFPQWVDAAHNRNARKLLVRDVDNLQSFLGRYTRQLKQRRYGKEMWDRYEHNELRPDSKLTGRFKPRPKEDDTYALLREIEELEKEARARRERLGLPTRPARQPVYVEPSPKKKKPAPAEASGRSDDAPKKKKRRRRRKKKKPEAESAPELRADLEALLVVDDS
jgi:RIO kinase 1